MQAYGFALRDERRLDSPFKAAMRRNEQYLLSLKPDRLLHRFRLNAALPPAGAAGAAGAGATAVAERR